MVSELEVYLKNTKETNKEELDSELLPYNDPVRTLTIQVLQHVLQCYNRIGDDTGLLTSGECRRPGDIK
jgi:hypothetical protein